MVFKAIKNSIEFHENKLTNYKQAGGRAFLPYRLLSYCLVDLRKTKEQNNRIMCNIIRDCQVGFCGLKYVEQCIHLVISLFPLFKRGVDLDENLL